MKHLVTILLGSLFCLALLAGCSNSYRGIAEKPETFAEPPKGGPVGANGGGATAPAAKPLP